LATDTVHTVDELLSQSECDLFVKTSIPGHSLHHLLPCIVVVTYVNVVNVDIHSTCPRASEAGVCRGS